MHVRGNIFLSFCHYLRDQLIVRNKEDTYLPLTNSKTVTVLTF